MTRVRNTAPKKITLQNLAEERYFGFEQLNGKHPWIDRMLPDGCVLYPVRKLKVGQIAYFNFKLAKEMGLIAHNHEEALNKELEQKLIDTFSIRIVNEFEQLQNVIYHPAVLKPNRYMATRYLQLQHPDRKGLRSGDGRCVWNGVAKHNGKAWDVSSRGTGVTALAPGITEAGHPLPSGSNKFGYGCGLAEIDELYGSAILAEIFYNNGLNTERMLAIIDLGGGVGIGVRAAPNLIRPAHLFLYVKQEQWEPLKKATDFFIDRQYANRSWDFSSTQPRAYDRMLNELCRSFAHFAAHLEREYIFAWLDWDGDNVLADAGIIDYGSVRQFGLRHDQYRYDDVDRYSTNLNEQRLKARQTIQAFCQLVDFLKTKQRKPLNHFSQSSILRKFDQQFSYFLAERFLYQMGFQREECTFLLKNHRKQVDRLFRSHSHLERKKTQRKTQNVADGINKPAIFNMRNILRYLPEVLLQQQANWPSALWAAKDFHNAMLAQAASKKDGLFSPALEKQIICYQTHYKKLIELVSNNKNRKSFLKHFLNRAQSMNRPDRITGNALIVLVEDLLAARKRGQSYSSIQRAVDAIIQRQALDPELNQQLSIKPPHLDVASRRLMIHFLSVLEGHKEDI